MQRDVSLQADVLLASFSMHLFVALSAQGNQILFLITTRVASKFEVVYLQILHAAAKLATPAVALQDFTTELTVRFRVQLQAWPFGSNSSQGATRTHSMNSFLCGFGRPSTSRVRADRRAFWLPVSKLAPARKSAQIISRQ